MSKGKAKGPQTSAEIQADIEARRAELDALDEQRREARNAIRRAERAAEKAAAREVRERDAALGLGIVAELRALGVGDDELAFAAVVAKLARATGLKWPDGRDETVRARAVRLRREAAVKVEGPHGPDAA